MSVQDEQSRVFYELSSMIIEILKSPPISIPFTFGTTPSSTSRQQAASSPTAFASLFLGMSLTLMLFGSVTFAIGFVLMPLVMSLFLLFYAVEILSNLSQFGRSILFPASSSTYVPVIQPVNFSDVRCDIPELKGDNYKVWKERILFHLGWMDIDYAIRKDKPVITDTSTQDEIALYERWERSNRLSVMFIKTKISAGIRGSVKQYEKVWALLKAIDEQFETSDKALASTLIMRFSSLRLTTVRGVREHIMEMRDIAAQLKNLEVDMSESFLVHYILNTLPKQYGPFKISYNTHKDKWSINELLTMCTQEEGRLVMEMGETALTTTRGKNQNQDQYQAKDKGKGKIPPKAVIKKESKCFFYKRKGHMKKDCTKFQSWLEKQGYAKTKEASGK